MGDAGFGVNVGLGVDVGGGAVPTHRKLLQECEQHWLLTAHHFQSARQDAFGVGDGVGGIGVGATLHRKLSHVREQHWLLTAHQFPSVKQSGFRVGVGVAGFGVIVGFGVDVGGGAVPTHRKLLQVREQHWLLTAHQLISFKQDGLSVGVGVAGFGVGVGVAGFGVCVGGGAVPTHRKLLQECEQHWLLTAHHFQSARQDAFGVGAALHRKLSQDFEQHWLLTAHQLISFKQDGLSVGVGVAGFGVTVGFGVDVGGGAFPVHRKLLQVREQHWLLTVHHFQSARQDAFGVDVGVTVGDVPKATPSLEHTFTPPSRLTHLPEQHALFVLHTLPSIKQAVLVGALVAVGAVQRPKIQELVQHLWLASQTCPFARQEGVFVGALVGVFVGALVGVLVGALVAVGFLVGVLLPTQYPK